MVFLKNRDYEKAEKYLLKAKSVTNPVSVEADWKQNQDWQLSRISIFHNIGILFKRQNKHKKAYGYLKSMIEIINLKENHKNHYFILSGCENLFINLADCAFILKKYEETIEYLQSALKILNKFLKNDLMRIEMRSLVPNLRTYEYILIRKKVSIAYCNFLMGKNTHKFE